MHSNLGADGWKIILQFKLAMMTWSRVVVVVVKVVGRERASCAQDVHVIIFKQMELMKARGASSQHFT